MTFGRKAFAGVFVPTEREVWWFVNVPRDRPLTKEEILAEGIDRWVSRLIGLFEGDRVPIEAILRAQGDDGIVVLGAQYDLPNVTTWHRGRVAIVGDAAHAASTSSGQGASMAMESAVTLGRCLRDCADPPAAFTAYERLRRERVAKIIAHGAKSASSKAAGPFSALMRDTFMRIGLKYFYKPESTDAWLLGHHIQFDAPVPGEPAA
jgi:2-polyprenyl-6-methoxyphenol hydroxylase-like FAD-dependent oxidoreductase